MNYYYDTEFLEGTQKTWFSKSKPTIDLISIGIISEDSREYYAISKDFNLKEAWNRYDLKYNTGMGDANNLPPKKVYWIRENVFKPIYDDLFKKIVKDDNMLTGAEYVYFNYSNLKKLIKRYGKSNKQIAFEVLNFIHGYDDMGNWLGTTNEYYNSMILQKLKNKPKFYGYYSAYDHVVLCWLFGKMIDLPEGFPMYTIDLKQVLDIYINKMSSNLYAVWEENIYGVGNYTPIKDCTNEDKLNIVKKHTSYPKQVNEHNALYDAKWNKQLHEFLKSL